ncbi:hypothetical protein F4778DRAFT_136630 [Xylariomycetidae sp. FL2044]|nr:hypothetical protein F4778DRAFT_136630 [Xylariomycetidae sp. FL2044]
MPADDRSLELATTTLVFIGVSAVAVTLRCYVRASLLKAFREEDFLALGTLFCFVVYGSFVMLSISNGAGKHVGDVPESGIPEALKMRWAAELSYVVTSLFLKFTIGVFLLRICSTTRQRIIIWIVLIGCLVFNLFYVFIAAFQCKPVEYFWMRAVEDAKGTCLSEEIILGSTYAAAAVNACADWVLGLMPIALVWNLDLNKRSKVSVAGILALGSIASSATIVRIPYIYQLAHDDDFLYEFTDLAIWSTVENGLGLTASSIATLRPLFRRLLGGGGDDTNRTSSASASASSSSYHPWSKRRSGPPNRGTNDDFLHCRGPSDVGKYYQLDALHSPGQAKIRYYREYYRDR